MKRNLIVISVAALTALSAMASAQYTREPIDPTPHNFSFRAGAVFPVDDTLREVSDTFLGLGIDYRFDKQYIKNSETFFSLDYIGRDAKGNQAHFFPLCINQRFWSDAQMMGRRTYFFVGVGAFFYDITRSETVVGFRGGVGVELGPMIFAEATFFISDETDDDTNGSSVGVYLGYRF